MQTSVVALAPVPWLMHGLPAPLPGGGPGLSINSTSSRESEMSPQLPKRKQGDKAVVSLEGSGGGGYGKQVFRSIPRNAQHSGGTYSPAHPEPDSAANFHPGWAHWGGGGGGDMDGTVDAPAPRRGDGSEPGGVILP